MDKAINLDELMLNKDINKKKSLSKAWTIQSRTYFEARLIALKINILPCLKAL